MFAVVPFDVEIFGGNSHTRAVQVDQRRHGEVGSADEKDEGGEEREAFVKVIKSASPPDVNAKRDGKDADAEVFQQGDAAFIGQEEDGGGAKDDAGGEGGASRKFSRRFSKKFMAVSGGGMTEGDKADGHFRLMMLF